MASNDPTDPNDFNRLDNQAPPRPYRGPDGNFYPSGNPPANGGNQEYRGLDGNLYASTHNPIRGLDGNFYQPANGGNQYRGLDGSLYASVNNPIRGLDGNFYPSGNPPANGGNQYRGLDGHLYTSTNNPIRALDGNLYASANNPPTRQNGYGLGNPPANGGKQFKGLDGKIYTLAGTPYRTIDAAGKAAVCAINPKSIKEDTEYGGSIYRQGDSYYYVEPQRGGAQESRYGEIPPGTGRAAIYHTHAAYTPNLMDGSVDRNLNFSYSKEGNSEPTGDIPLSNSLGIPNYMADPHNTIHKYDPIEHRYDPNYPASRAGEILGGCPGGKKGKITRQQGVRR